MIPHRSTSPRHAQRTRTPPPRSSLMLLSSPVTCWSSRRPAHRPGPLYRAAPCALSCAPCARRPAPGGRSTAARTRTWQPSQWAASPPRWHEAANVRERIAGVARLETASAARRGVGEQGQLRRRARRRRRRRRACRAGGCAGALGPALWCGSAEPVLSAPPVGPRPAVWL
jgi:hypothetical protein